jgi:hypothetical protein
MARFENIGNFVWQNDAMPVLGPFEDQCVNKWRCVAIANYLQPTHRYVACFVNQRLEYVYVPFAPVGEPTWVDGCSEQEAASYIANHPLQADLRPPSGEMLTRYIMYGPWRCLGDNANDFFQDEGYD